MAHYDTMMLSLTHYDTMMPFHESFNIDSSSRGRSFMNSVREKMRKIYKEITVSEHKERKINTIPYELPYELPNNYPFDSTFQNRYCSILFESDFELDNDHLY